MNTQPLGPWLGINNRLPDFALHVAQKGDFLRSADNVDIDNSGHLRRRQGRTLIQAMTAPHSLYKTADGRYFLVRANALYHVTLPNYSETLVKILTVDDKVSYAEWNGDLYYSNGTDCGRVSAANVWYPWGMATPDQPAVGSIVGTLPPGWYQIGVTYYNAVTGEESGCAGTTNTELTGEAAFRVTLPGASPGATHVNVYVTGTNGETPGLYATVAIGTATLDITSLTTTQTLQTAYEVPMPAGSRIFIYNGRLASVVGKTLVYSPPYRPGYYVPARDYILFEENIGTAVPAQNGVYVAADKTRWIPGDLNAPSDQIQDVLPYGAVPGTEFVLPHSSKVGWFGAKGVIIADTQGQAAPIMSDNVDLIAPGSGLSIVLEDRGYRRVLSCGWCVNVESGVATKYSNFDMTSAAGGYASMADGIYALSGEDDAGTPITWSAGLGKQNFGVENEKFMPASYIGASSAEPIELRIQTPAGEDYVYPARSCSDGIEIHRIDPGRGLRANWFDLTLQGESDFDLASVSFAPVASTRRI